MTTRPPRRPLILVLAFLGLSALACGGSSSSESGALDDSPSDDDSASDSSGPDPVPDELADCAGDLTSAEVDNALVIVDDLEQSYHEMVACGGLQLSLLSGLLGYLYDVALYGPDAADLPDGYSFEGDGLYVAAPDGMGDVYMESRFYFGDDYVAGAHGELVTPNLFDSDSYLTNLRVEEDWQDFEVVLRYDDVGPLVELLGFGSDPDSPLRIGMDQAESIGTELGKLLNEMELHVVDDRSASTVDYTLDSPLETVSTTLEGGLLNLDLVGATAVREDLGQALTSEDWEIEYVDGPGGLDGTISFVINGDEMDFGGTFTYVESVWPERELYCLE